MSNEITPANTPQRTKGNAFKVIFTFLILGCLCGFLMGLTESPIVNSFLTSLFAIAGTVSVIFFTKMSNEQINLTLNVLLGLSIGCIVGVLIGIRAKEFEWFVPEKKRSEFILKDINNLSDSLTEFYGSSRQENRKPLNSDNKDSFSIQLEKEMLLKYQKLINQIYTNYQSSQLSKPVLRNLSMNKINYINSRLNGKTYTPQEAYDELYKYITDELQKNN
jgi:hypothetical protein